ncbi:hypothetical protein J6590_088460 [Homalodisca vitripennis]|nr:hypothetical protein J6590_088460 [Homalodisca vitripennis]
MDPRSHKYYNEYVDNLAEEAVNNGSEVTDIYITSADVKAHQLKEATTANEQVHQRTEKGKWYKQIQIKSIHNRWYEMTNFKRWEMVNIISLRFGHARVNSRLFDIKQYFTPLCLSCTRAQRETLDHVILHCPAYEFATNKHFKVTKKLNHTYSDVGESWIKRDTGPRNSTSAAIKRTTTETCSRPPLHQSQFVPPRDN